MNNNPGNIRHNHSAGSWACPHPDCDDSRITEPLDASTTAAHGANDMNIVTKQLEWQHGPDSGYDPLLPECLAEKPPGFECGDYLLVLVAARGLRKDSIHWDASIIISTETGFDDQNRDSWSAWSWSDVSWWVKLDKSNLPPLFPTKSPV